MKGSATILERHNRLRSQIEKNPFISDEQLAGVLHASIHTIRSDRRKIGIPEVRKRGADASRSLFASARALSQQEIVGEILELEVGREGLSILETTPDMGLQKSGVVRGHILFAQANTLANALAEGEVAVTSRAQVEFLAPAYVGERTLAKAHVIRAKKRKKIIEVVIKTPERQVLQGIFTIYSLDSKLASHLHLYVETNKKGAP